MLSVLAASGLALAASHDFVREFGGFLAVLLYLFTPWTAINLVDFYVVRKGHYSVREIFNARGMYGRWNWRGLTAYGAGFAAMIPFFSTDVYTGPVGCGARRCGHRHAGGAAGVGGGLSHLLPFHGPGVGPAAGARGRRRPGAAQFFRR